jgi:hypothetical protein
MDVEAGLFGGALVIFERVMHLKRSFQYNTSSAIIADCSSEIEGLFRGELWRYRLLR